MTLDVLIPSYNRAQFVDLQVASLKIIRQQLSGKGIDLRVVVSDNHSVPAVASSPEHSDFVKIARPPEHLPTAEENVFWGIQQCTAEYIWLLGDDDAPIIENAVSIISEIHISRPDYVVTNSSGSLVGGGWKESRTICSNERAIRTLPDFVLRTGFTFVMAGFSCIICKREKFNGRMDLFGEYFKTSKIYSLVFWLLDVFWEGDFRYFNRPLVIYKQNESDVNGHHWVKVAGKLDVFQKYFWTLGLTRLFQKLIDRKKIAPGFLSRAIEQNWNSRFPALALALILFLEQLKIEADPKGKSACRLTTPDERGEFFRFLIREEPRYLEVYAPIAGRADISLQQIERCHKLLQKQLARFYRAFFIEAVGDWNLYFYDDIYRAFPAQLMRRLKSEIADISPVGSEYQIVGASREVVLEQILKRPYLKYPAHGFKLPIRMLPSEIRVLKKWARLVIMIKAMMPQNLLKRFVKNLRS